MEPASIQSAVVHRNLRMVDKTDSLDHSFPGL